MDFSVNRRRRETEPRAERPHCPGACELASQRRQATASESRVPSQSSPNLSTCRVVSICLVYFAGREVALSQILIRKALGERARPTTMQAASKAPRIVSAVLRARIACRR